VTWTQSILAPANPFVMTEFGDLKPLNPVESMITSPFMLQHGAAHSKITPCKA
jgi:hypothetical protein